MALQYIMRTLNNKSFNHWKKNYMILPVFLLFFMIINVGIISLSITPTESAIETDETNYDFNEKLKASGSEHRNREIIEELLNAKLQNYSDLGYFPQYYEPSLQAIYYIVSVLSAINGLNDVNISRITDFVMDHYDSDTDMFIDEYALRYLDTDDNQLIYPYTSLLQVNCYAILTLNLLNKIDLIDTQAFIDFIWSCFNYEYGGFIGQPYSADLESYFKVPALDTHYFAMLTLDSLGLSWGDYNTEIDLITQFIESLQVDTIGYPTFGGFYNDPSLYSVETTNLKEPNMHTSYYALKSLKIINLEEVIDLDGFMQFFSSLYKEELGCFVSSKYENARNFTNVAATAMGIEISQIMEWDGLNESNAISFLRDNRNRLGLWKTSSDKEAYELIDTYQVVRSLYDINLLSEFTSQELNDTVEGLEVFKQYNGYSIISKEFNTIDQMHTVIRVCKMFERIPDLEIGSLYNQLVAAYKEGIYFETFYYYSHPEELIKSFRTYPFEYFSWGRHELSGGIGRTFGHKATYKALISMLDMYKLDDFQIGHDLSLILEKVLGSQFLDSNYENYGGFMPYAVDTDPALQNSMVFLEHTYYAIRSIEFLADYLELGNLTSQAFDKDALNAYINGNIVETPEELYYEPNYLTDDVGRLKNTYYMLYILNATASCTINMTKLTEFVNNSIDYQNIESVYYCFKLNTLMDLGLEFDVLTVQDMIPQIYDHGLMDCFTSVSKEEIDQTILLMLVEMALQGEMMMVYETNSPSLGYPLSINVSLSNMILNSFGSYITVKYESESVGTNTLSPYGSYYHADIIIPVEKINYPMLNGTIKVFLSDTLKTSKKICTPTNYTLETEYSAIKDNNETRFYVKGTIKTESGTSKLLSSNVSIDVYRNGILEDKRDFDIAETEKYTEFTLEYTLPDHGNYTFKVYLTDGLSKETSLLFTDNYEYSAPADPPPPLPPPP
ncbi:MAG: hypothetical protein BAJALOKI2v1_540001, partial [Promethearchaeota archaeon]